MVWAEDEARASVARARVASAERAAWEGNDGSDSTKEPRVELGFRCRVPLAVGDKGCAIIGAKHPRYWLAKKGQAKRKANAGST